ncbi:MAG TPA: hypothetical protein VL860_07345 [Planctomycetota bacterium]|jgi:hypothetical protein|nr:hypothetical protein [Planctomycetota bacterium]
MKRGRAVAALADGRWGHETGGVGSFSAEMRVLRAASQRESKGKDAHNPWYINQGLVNASAVPETGTPERNEFFFP